MTELSSVWPRGDAQSRWQAPVAARAERHSPGQLRLGALQRKPLVRADRRRSEAQHRYGRESLGLRLVSVRAASLALIDVSVARMMQNVQTRVSHSTFMSVSRMAR